MHGEGCSAGEGSPTAAFQRKPGLTAAAAWPCAPAPQTGRNLTANSVCQSTLRGSCMEEREATPLGGAAVAGHAGSAGRRKCSCAVTSLSQHTFSFPLLGRDKAGSTKPQACGRFPCEPCVGSKKGRRQMLHRPDEPIPAHKISTCFSALASRTRSAAAFAVPRRSGSQGYVVSISLHLLPSNLLPSRKELRKLSWGGLFLCPLHLL